ncbi:peptide ABC transporter substrate-binding protein [Micromonospora sp. CPCC 205371]|nr:peptide ABC transporter substrate-binding protein [Micromonospora sp. CPCC 205371]
MTRLRRRVGVVAVLATFMAGCSGGGDGQDETVKGGVLSVGVTAELGRLESLNPMASNLLGSWLARQMVYPALVQLDGASLRPAWAQSWEASADGRVYTFRLRDGSWSDGTPLTAEDAVWTATTELKYKDGAAGLVAFALAGVESVAAPDPRTFVVTYTKPVAPGALTALAYFSVLPKHIWEPHAGNDGKDLATFHPEDQLPLVSGGPYTVTEFDPDGTTIFEPNPKYYGDKPQVDAVGVQVFQNAEGMVQALKTGALAWGYSDGATIAKSVEGTPGLSVKRTPGRAVALLNINSNPDKPDHPELKNVRVREAMSLAIDRAELIEVALNGFGQPGRSLLVPAQAGWIPEAIAADPFDPARANAILDELGYRRGTDGIRVTGTGAPMRYELVVWEISRVVEILQKNLKDVGIDLQPKLTEEYTATVTAPDGKYLDFDLAFSYWEFLDPDPNVSLNIYTCGSWGSVNFAGYCDQNYDTLHTQQQATVDETQRHAQVGQMQQLLLRDARATLPLYHADGVHVVGTGWAGIEPQRYGADLWTGAHRVKG